MINFDDITRERIKAQNPKWLQIHDHPYKILIIGGSESGKINALLNRISRNQIPIKSICKLRLHMKQSTNC